MRITTLLAGIAILGAGPAFGQDVTLTINSPGGAIQEGGRAVLWGPAAEKLGVAIKEETADNGLDALRLQANANAVTTDIIVLSGYQAAIAGAEGLLEPIDYSVVDGSKFLPGTAAEYCTGIYAVGVVLGWNTNTYQGEQPASWPDFWNVEKFPGTRALRADAEAQIEMALLGDGVAPEDVYEVLSTDEGLQRAIDKLAEIKPNVAVWWSSGAQLAQLMTDGEVDMASGWNGRLQAAKSAGGPADYTFNNGILTIDCFAVPKASPNKEVAMQLINEMSSGESQAGLTRYISYGPTNLDAYSTGIISDETAALLPTHPDYADSLVVLDIDWWVANNDRAQQMFEDMMTE